MDKTANHIYVVDDDDMYRKSLVRLLTAAGHSVESFSSANSFLESVRVADKTGVLILDLRLPGMNGFDLQKRMNELASGLHIIFVTGHEHAGDREHAINAGAIGFLQKPFEEGSLLELLGSAMETLLNYRHPKTQGRRHPQPSASAVHHAFKIA
jgi:two-component system response regulator FixJ